MLITLPSLYDVSGPNLTLEAYDWPNLVLRWQVTGCARFIITRTSLKRAQNVHAAREYLVSSSKRLLLV